jgi:Holliday junction resolvase RusA-like endonuclease
MSTETILDLPPPPSVNRTRRINWASRPAVKRWMMHADGLVTEQRAMRQSKLTGQFEATVILSEDHSGIDLDNSPKQIIDYARRLGFMVNDDRKHMRRVIIEWGFAPHGCRLILRPIAGDC